MVTDTHLVPYTENTENIVVRPDHGSQATEGVKCTAKTRSQTVSDTTAVLLMYLVSHSSSNSSSLRVQQSSTPSIQQHYVRLHLWHMCRYHLPRYSCNSKKPYRCSRLTWGWWGVCRTLWYHDTEYSTDPPTRNAYSEQDRNPTY